jgi:hypothetical protein
MDMGGYGEEKIASREEYCLRSDSSDLLIVGLKAEPVGAIESVWRHLKALCCVQEG